MYLYCGINKEYCASHLVHVVIESTPQNCRDVIERNSGTTMTTISGLNNIFIYG